MRSLAFFLVFLTLPTGCVLEDKLVIPEDGGVEAGKCIVCPSTTPVCYDDTLCVECTTDDTLYCTQMMQVCKTDVFECVDCNESSDCDDADAAHCNAETNECEGCRSDTDCNGIDGLPRCEADTDTCVQCTPETEGPDCLGKSCNPETFTCTGTAVGSVDTCEECVSDSECGEAGNRCVAMEYQDEAYPDSQTGFCLKSIDLGGSCTNPYRIVITRTSLSGAEADDYCGINEDLATCQAVRALLADDPCNPVNEDLDCPQPSGLCRELPGMLNRCTYLCSDVVECKSPPAPGSTCDSSGAGGAGGAGGAYCGG